MIRTNGEALDREDGAAVSEEERLTFEGPTPAEFLLFDLN